MTMPLFTCFQWSRTVMHTDFLIDQFARNIKRSGLCNITLHAEMECKRNNDLFYSLNAYKKHMTMYHDAIIVLEHSFRYIKSIYYSLVALSKSSYLYIDFAICKWSWICIACSFYFLLFVVLQKAYKLAIHRY